MSRISTDTRMHILNAQRVVRFVHNKLGTKSPSFYLLKYYQNAHNPKIDKITKGLHNTISNLDNILGVAREEMAKTGNIFCIENYKVANCGELINVTQALMARFFGIASKRIAIHTKALSVARKPFDHCFLVINHAKGFKSDDVKSWGQGAYIVDPWLKFVLPAKEGLACIDRMLYVVTKKTFVKKEGQRLSDFYKDCYDFVPSRNKFLERVALVDAFRLSFEKAQENTIKRISGYHCSQD